MIQGEEGKLNLTLTLLSQLRSKQRAVTTPQGSVASGSMASCVGFNGLTADKGSRAPTARQGGNALENHRRAYLTRQAGLQLTSASEAPEVRIYCAC